MISSNFAYFLKSYLWTSSFTVKEMAKFTGIKSSRLDNLIKKDLPTPEEVQGLVKKLSLDKQMAWTAFFNSILMSFHQEPNVVLRDYQSFKKMLLNNRKNRKKLKHHSIPADECFVELLPETYSLNDMTLANKLKYGLKVKMDKKQKQLLAKDFKMTPNRLDKILKGDIPTIAEITEMYFNERFHPFADSVIRAYLSQVNQKLNLGYKIDFLKERSYMNLLDKIDCSVARTKRTKRK